MSTFDPDDPPTVVKFTIEHLPPSGEREREEPTVLVPDEILRAWYVVAGFLDTLRLLWLPDDVFDMIYEMLGRFGLENERPEIALPEGTPTPDLFVAYALDSWQLLLSHDDDFTIGAYRTERGEALRQALKTLYDGDWPLTRWSVDLTAEQWDPPTELPWWERGTPDQEGT